MRLFGRKSEQKKFVQPQHAAAALIEFCAERRMASSEEMSQHQLPLTPDQQRAFDQHVFMTNVAFVVYWLHVMQQETNESKIAKEILAQFEIIKNSDLSQQELLVVSQTLEILAQQVQELPLPNGPLTPENRASWDANAWCALWITAVPQRGPVEKEVASRYGKLLLPHLQKSKEMFKLYVEGTLYTTGAFTA